MTQRDPIDAAKKAVGNLIRRHRQDLGWNQTQLGDRVGAEQSTVSEWERGASLPKDLAAVAAALDAPLDTFRQAMEAAVHSTDDIEESIRNHPLLSKESVQALVVMYRKALAADTATS